MNPPRRGCVVAVVALFLIGLALLIVSRLNDFCFQREAQIVLKATHGPADKVTNYSGIVREPSEFEQRGRLQRT